MESPFGLNPTQMSYFLHKFSLDTHNSHVGNAVGQGHKGHLWPKWPYVAFMVMAISIANLTVMAYAKNNSSVLDSTQKDFPFKSYSWL